VELGFVLSTFSITQCQLYLPDSLSRNSELTNRPSVRLKINVRRRRINYSRRRLGSWLRRKRSRDERRRQNRGGRRRRNGRRGLRRPKMSMKDKRSWNRRG
jgi:hypothetical protein